MDTLGDGCNVVMVGVVGNIVPPENDGIVGVVDITFPDEVGYTAVWEGVGWIGEPSANRKKRTY